MNSSKTAKQFTVGYAIHNKEYMIDKITYGLVEHIEEEVDYIFIFDGCTDKSEERFEKLKGVLGCSVQTLQADNIFQVLSCNMLMQLFNTEYLIIFQDDMVLNDKEFLDNLRRIIGKYGDGFGVIGCRDGFESKFSEMVGSEFSTSERKILRNGEYAERSMLNMGPLVLSRRVVDNAGYFNEIYSPGAYSEIEYTLKCKLDLGLVNVVMGANIIHSKWPELLKDEKLENITTSFIEHDENSHKIFNTRWEGKMEL